MSHVKLIFGGNKLNREEELFKNVNIKSPDVLVVQKEDEKKSIGIDKIREGIKFLQEKPFELKFKFLIIPLANILTHEAQNALLKTLEEPPIYADIRLGTKAEKDLLDTVISRCTRVDLNKKTNVKNDRVGESEEKKPENTYDYIVFKKSNVGEKLDFVEELAKEEKEDIIEILEQWINSEREFLIAGKSKNTNSIETLIKIKNDLENTNMNTKFLMEFLAINS